MEDGEQIVLDEGRAAGPGRGECSVGGCAKERLARTWCKTHYGRWHTHGDPLGRAERTTYATPEESFLARTEPLPWSGCLIWTGYADKHGYGQIKVGGRMVGAHRYAYEQEYGPVPDGEVVDHLYHCDRACCEPSHLRATTVAQNLSHRNGATSRSTTGVRGVHPRRGGFQVMIRAGGVRRGGWHREFVAAAAESEAIIASLGEHGGRARKVGHGS